MERLTKEKQIGPFAALKDEAESVPGAFGTYDCLYAHMIAITRLKRYEDTGLEPEEITTKPYGCVFYCNRKCNLDGDFCAEGPGCPREIDAETAKHLLELAQAEKDGRLIAYLPGEKVYDRFGTPWIIESSEIHLIQGELKQLFRCGHPGTEDYYAMYEDEILTREEAEAALKKRGENNETDDM